MVLILEVDDTHVIKWCIDGVYGVHPDMQSHTGTYTALGKCASYSSSFCQKTNTQSSIEAEVVAVDQMMGQILLINIY